MICLSLHPIRETLPSLLLLRPTLCPLFNPAERPGNRGSKLISSGVRTHNAFVAVANVKLLLSMRGWVSGAGTTTDAVQAFGQMLFLLINHILCLLVLLISHQNMWIHCHRCVAFSVIQAFFCHNCEVIKSIQISSYYIIIIAYIRVEPVVMWASGNVINHITISLCLEHYFPNDVTPDVWLVQLRKHGVRKGVDLLREQKTLISSSLPLRRWKTCNHRSLTWFQRRKIQSVGEAQPHWCIKSLWIIFVMKTSTTPTFLVWYDKNTKSLS